MNLYGMIDNNPLNDIDLLGLIADRSDDGGVFTAPVKEAVGKTHFNNLKISLVVCAGRAIAVADKVYESLKSFEHFNQGNTSTISVIDDVAVFWPNGKMQSLGLDILGHDLVAVTLSHDDNRRRVTAETTARHFLNGRRTWGVSVAGRGESLMIYTVARERYSSRGFLAANFMAGILGALDVFDVLGFNSFEQEVKGVWSQYLNNVADAYISSGDVIKKENESWSYFTN
jgi:hypothetical protein